MIQIGVDFEGWPVNAMNLKQILKDLGFKEEDGKIFIENDSPILDAYPLLLEDDGMAYGVNPQFVIETDNEIYEHKIKAIGYEIGEDPKLDIKRVVKDETINVFNIFRDVPENKVEEDDEE